jgi:hypothetical protein
MRLYDRIPHAGAAVTGVPVQPAPVPAPATPPPPATVTEEEMRDIIRALRRESFDQTRMKVARQILSSNPKPFLSSQIKQMLDCFDFEPSKLELAKFAYQYTYDPARYYLVNETFSFPNTKEELARYIESGHPAPPPGNPGRPVPPQFPPPRR